MAKKPERAPSPPVPPDLPERWSAQRKQEVVLRLLRGDSLDQVSRETQVPAHELESCNRGRWHFCHLAVRDVTVERPIVLVEGRQVTGLRRAGPRRRVGDSVSVWAVEPGWGVIECHIPIAERGPLGRRIFSFDIRPVQG